MTPFGARDAIVALAVAGLLAAFWFHGRHVGGLEVRAEWQAQQLADREAADAQAETDRLLARAASAGFEAARTRLQQQAAKARAALRIDLEAPFICPTGDTHALNLADLPVPAAAVGRLRDAAGQGTQGH